MKKTKNFFPSILSPFGNPIINLSPDSDDGGTTSGDQIKFTEEQESEVQKRIDEALEGKKPDLQSSLKFIKNAGGRAYLSNKDFETDVVENLNKIMSERIDNPNEVQKSLLKFKSGLIGEVLTPVDQTIKELTGVEKNEDEKTRDYAKRALETIKKDDSIDEGAYNAIKGKLNQANSKYEQLEQKYNELLSSQEQERLNTLKNKGIDPSVLDYAEEELKFVLPGIQAQIDNNFEFKKDEKGYVAINKETNEPVLDESGNRKPVDKVVSEFVQKLPGIKFKEDVKPGGARMPGEQGSMSDGEKQKAEEVWKEKLSENNLLGHERKAFVLRKELGLPIPQKAVEKWPELK